MMMSGRAKLISIIWTLTLLHSSIDGHTHPHCGNAADIVNEKDEDIVANDTNKLLLMYRHSPEIDNQYEFCEWATLEQLERDDSSLYTSKECYTRNKGMRMDFDGKAHYAYFPFSHGNRGKLAECSNPLNVSMHNCTHGNNVYSVCYHNCNGASKRAICKLNGTCNIVTIAWEGSECPTPEEDDIQQVLVTPVLEDPDVSKEDEDTDASGMEIKEILGIIIGCFFLLCIIAFCCWKCCYHKVRTIKLDENGVVKEDNAGTGQLLENGVVKEDNAGTGQLLDQCNVDVEAAVGDQQTTTTVQYAGAGVDIRKSDSFGQNSGYSDRPNKEGLSELYVGPYCDSFGQNSGYSDRPNKENEDEMQRLMEPLLAQGPLDPNSLGSKGTPGANKTMGQIVSNGNVEGAVGCHRTPGANKNVGQIVSDRNVEGAVCYHKPSDANKNVGHTANPPDDAVKCTTSVRILFHQSKAWMDEFCELVEDIGTNEDDTLKRLVQQMHKEVGFYWPRGVDVFVERLQKGCIIPSTELLNMMSEKGIQIGVLVKYFKRPCVNDHILIAHPDCNYCQQEAHRKMTARSGLLSI